MNLDKKVKKTLQWESTIIELYEVERKSVPIGGFANIEAFDTDGNLLWTADPPESKFDFYFDIKIDAANNALMAYTAISFLAKISLENGKTQDFKTIK
jgi:hypothetical protein